MPTEYVEVLVKFPKLETADASDLRKLFPQRDGIWSDLIRWARGNFNIDKIDLNENWASMSINWRCRGCDREKFECLRVYEGILFAHLEEHHDHLADRPQELFRERFGRKWVATTDRQFGFIEPMIARLIQRFNPTFIARTATVPMLRFRINSSCPSTSALRLVKFGNLSHLHLMNPTGSITLKLLTYTRPCRMIWKRDCRSLII